MKKLLNILIIILIISFIGSFGVLLLNKNNDFNGSNNSNSSNSSVNSNIDFTQLTYTSLGDSITYGAYLKGKLENPYPILVGDELGLIKVTNLGVGGYTLAKDGKYGSIQDVVKNVPEYSNIISVMGGANDFAQSKTLGSITDTDTKTIYGGLKYIAQTLINEHPNSFIFFMTALPMGDKKLEQFSSSEITIEEINVAVIEVAKLYNIPVLDTYNLADYQSEMNNSLVTDGCHPSKEFHENKLAPLIAQFIKDNYKK